MAARYYGVANGGGMPTEVTKAASTTGMQYQFSIANTTATGATKEQALKALEAIRSRVICGTWPPA